MNLFSKCKDFYCEDSKTCWVILGDTNFFSCMHAALKSLCQSVLLSVSPSNALLFLMFMGSFGTTVPLLKALELRYFQRKNLTAKNCLIFLLRLAPPSSVLDLNYFPISLVDQAAVTLKRKSWPQTEAYVHLQRKSQGAILDQSQQFNTTPTSTRFAIFPNP